jgi:hypothetical protein
MRGERQDLAAGLLGLLGPAGAQQGFDLGALGLEMR